MTYLIFPMQINSYIDLNSKYAERLIKQNKVIMKKQMLVFFIPVIMKSTVCLLCFFFRETEMNSCFILH